MQATEAGQCEAMGAEEGAADGELAVLDAVEKESATAVLGIKGFHSGALVHVAFDRLYGKGERRDA